MSWEGGVAGGVAACYFSASTQDQAGLAQIISFACVCQQFYPCIIMCRLAKQWWLDGLTAVLGVKNPLATWRKVTPITLKGCGLWGCLLGAMMAIKLLR